MLVFCDLCTDLDGTIWVDQIQRNFCFTASNLYPKAFLLFSACFVHSGVQARVSSGARLLLSTWRMQVSQQNQGSSVIFTQNTCMAKFTVASAQGGQKQSNFAVDYSIKDMLGKEWVTNPAAVQRQMELCLHWCAIYSTHFKYYEAVCYRWYLLSIWCT